jgi:hypothetical protein
MSLGTSRSREGDESEARNQKVAMPFPKDISSQPLFSYF